MGFGWFRGVLLFFELRHISLVDSWNLLSPFDGLVGAHVPTEYFLGVQLVHHGLRLAWLLDHILVLLPSSFDLLQQLVFPLYLEDPLAMDVFDVEVLPGDNQRPLPAYVIESIAALTWLVHGQTALNKVGLLETVDGIGLEELVGDGGDSFLVLGT